MKKLISCLVLSAMICGCFASCGSEEASDNEKESSKVEATEAPEEEATEAPTEAEATEAPEEDEESVPQAVVTDDIEVEPSIAAESGDAFIYINDGQFWIGYDGTNDNPNMTMLTYNAGVTPIAGNGDYTVSLTSDTVGFRLDTTGDANDDSCIPGGMSFMALIIKDGTEKCPDAVITINEIRLDGEAIPMSAKNYTSSDDGKELRSNIYNAWVNKLPADARSTEGALADEDGNLLDIAADYSPQIVSPDDFTEWKTVEVDFTISGMAG